MKLTKPKAEAKPQKDDSSADKLKRAMNYYQYHLKKSKRN